MKGIVTVIGKDKVGIIAKVTGLLSGMNLNVEDITQTVMQEFFMMMMLLSLPDDADMKAISEKLDETGRALGVHIRIQHEDIFNAMHRI
ncbi:MAG: ACT domain-containing protein [Clostridiales bacterium]|jgi:ACT domain-containing protein|nr:ACT domain-containing protein [Clostridiales bacterium]